MPRQLEAGHAVANVNRRQLIIIKVGSSATRLTKAVRRRHAQSANSFEASLPAAAGVDGRAREMLEMEMERQCDDV